MPSDNLLLNVVLAWVVPPLVEFINTQLTTDWQKKAAAILTSVFVGLVATLPQIVSENGATWENLLTNIGVVLAASQTYYALLWKKSDVQKAIQNL